MANDGGWDFDSRYERDNEREPTRRSQRPRPQLNARGTVRVAHEAAVANKPLCLVGATAQDGSSFALCTLPEGHRGPHVFPKIGGAR